MKSKNRLSERVRSKSLFVMSVCFIAARTAAVCRKKDGR